MIAWLGERCKPVHSMANSTGGIGTALLSVAAVIATIWFVNKIEITSDEINY
jgi:hypothetical protein